MLCDTSERLRWKSLLLAGALLLWAGSLRAQVVTLHSLEQQALSRRATLNVARAKLDRTRADVDLARASRHPTFSFDADGALAPGNSLIRVLDVDGHEYRVLGSRPLGRTGAFSPEPRYSAALSIRGTLYDFGRGAERVDAAKAGSRAAQADVAAARAAVLRQVQHAYLDWVVAVAAARLVARDVDNADAQRKAVAGYVEEGKRPPSDLLSARVEVAQARLDLVEARGRIGDTRLALERASAVSLSRTATPDPRLLDIVPSGAKAVRSPTLTAIERRGEAARASAESHAHRWAPVVSGMAEAGVYGQKATVFPSYRVGLKLSVPLWDGGTDSARREIARATAAELSAETNDLGRKLSYAQRQARADWKNADSRVKIAESFQRAARAALAAAEERYRLGDGLVESVIKARSRVNEASLRLLGARGARADAVLRLRGLGGGNAR